MTKLEQALAAIDAVNSRDPEAAIVGAEHSTKGLVYGRRMSQWLDRMYPGASDALRIAARAQHLRRWEIPRDSFPRDRRGYLMWRKRLYKFHAEAAAELLASIGYDSEFTARVGELLEKKRLTTDPEAQALEDAACLVFLQYHLADFALDRVDNKLRDIIQKTWKKMSPHAHAFAQQLLPQLNPRLQQLLRESI